MADTIIYHNPRCTKSRQALKLLQEKDEHFKIVYYLEDPPSEKELTDLVCLLGIEPFDLIRRGEVLFKENFKGKDLTGEEWIKVMTENPKLIERPIVVRKGKARIGRPTERIHELF